MTVSQIALVGDSQTEGTYLDFAYSRSGQGSWAELLADRLANISGIGPLLSSGFRGVGLGLAGSVEWTFTTGGDAWTGITSASAFDKLPYGIGRYAFGPAKIATYTIPNHQRPNVGFALYYVDLSNGGNWQYRIDGGAWTNMGQTLSHNDALCKFYVPTPVTSTVEIRASSDASTGVNCIPAGIELFYASPSTTQGLIVHNVALDGRELHELALTGSGDRMAWFDSVTQRGANTISNTPAAGIVIMQLTNDCHLINNTATYASDITTVRNRLASIGPLLVLNVWEYSGEASQQASYRAQAKTTWGGFSPVVPVIDLYDAWASNGITGYTQAAAAGLMGDIAHESQLSHFDIARRAYGPVRNTFFPLFANAPTSYPIVAKSAASGAYAAKAAAVAFSAAAPIAIVPV